MRNALAAAALLLAGCQDPLLTAEIEVPRLEVTLPSQAFPESYTQDPTKWCDPAGQTDPPCVATAIDYDLGAKVPALTNDTVSYDLRLTDVTITLSASSSLTDLSGVQSAQVRIGYDPAIPGSGTIVASYVRPDPVPNPPPTTVSVAGKAEVDIGPYLDAGHLPFRAEVVLDAATPAFDADVTAGFSLVMNVNWGAYVF